MWRVLTDYEELARVVPFLEESRPVKYQNSRRLQLFQRAAFSSPFWKLAGEGVLDVEERLLPLGLREIRFKMIQGDFEVMHSPMLMEICAKFHCQVFLHLFAFPFNNSKCHLCLLHAQ